LFSFQLYSLAAFLAVSANSSRCAQNTCVLDQHETLGVRNDLRRVQSLLEVIDEGLAVAREAWAWSIEETGGTTTLRLERTQATGEDSLANQSNGHTEIQSVDSGPLSGTFLTSGVHDLLDNGDTVVVILVHDVAGDLDEERVEYTLVPLGENIAHLLVGHAETTLHDIVGLPSVSVQDFTFEVPILTSQISCISPYSIPLWTILT
jgi:hypothetical protein